MTVTLKHSFTSPKSDGIDSTMVQPSNWNANHTLTLGAGKVLGRDSSGAGAVQELPLSFDATLQSMIPPSGTTAQRPGTPTAGMIRFNTTIAGLEIYKSGAWGSLGGSAYVGSSAPSGSQPGDLWYNSTTGQLLTYSGTAWVNSTINIAVAAYSGDGTSKTFTLTADPGSKNNTSVYISGVYQQKANYSVSGTTLTFVTAPPAGTNNVEITSYAPVSSGVPNDVSVTTAKLVDASVTTAKIADANITTAKIADANVTTAKIADASVTFAKLANIATQVQAEAGTDNATVMTPLRAAQAIAALGPTGGLTLLGTLATTSGSSPTLSGLNLTGYVSLLFDFIGVSHNGTANAYLRIGSAQITDSESAASIFYGQAIVSLSTGHVSSTVDSSASMPRAGNIWRGLTGYSNATTSVVLSTLPPGSGASYDAGSVKIYGVK